MNVNLPLLLCSKNGHVKDYEICKESTNFDFKTDAKQFSLRLYAIRTGHQLA